MRKTLFSLAAATLLVAGAGVACADSTTTTTTTRSWSPDMGPALSQYSETHHWSSIDEPSLHPSIGMQVPPSVTLHPLPETMNVPDSSQYSYSIINNQPVVVKRSTRTVVHTWD